VSWADYFQDAPQGGVFRQFSATAIDPHFFPLPLFLAQAAGRPGVGTLPTVSFVDPNFGLFGIKGENDEHPPTDIQRGQAFVSQVISAVRNGPYWDDSVILIAYDEHGGAYDHVARRARPRPTTSRPASAPTCRTRPRASRPAPAPSAPSRWAAARRASRTRSSCVRDGRRPDRAVPAPLCEVRSARHPRPVPRHLAVRQAPLRLARGRRHTSILAFIESAFLPGHPFLTERDRNAYDLRDLFDFSGAPSRTTAVGHAAPPAVDCTPVP